MRVCVHPQNMNLNIRTVGVWVIEENLETVDEVCSVERIAADANTKSLTKPGQRGLVNSLICQSSRTRYNAWASTFITK